MSSVSASMNHSNIHVSHLSPKVLQKTYQNVVKSWWIHQDACTPCERVAYCGTWLCRGTACRRTEAPCRTLAACVAADCRGTCSCGHSPRSGATDAPATHLLFLPIQYVICTWQDYNVLNINWVFSVTYLVYLKYGHRRISCSVLHRTGSAMSYMNRNTTRNKAYRRGTL